MRLTRWQFILARSFFLAYVLFTSTYCLLAYIPFTYQQVHLGGLLPWLTRLVHLHALIYWPACVTALLTIFPDLKSGPARFLARGFALATLLAGIAISIHPLLPALSNDVSSLRWCILSLVPLLWLAIIDWLDSRNSLTWPGIADNDSSKVFLACFCTAAYLSIIYFQLAVFRGSASLPLRASEWLWLLLWSLLSHLLIFFLLFVLLDLISIAASLFTNKSTQSKSGFIGALLLVIFLIALSLRYIILPSLSVYGLPAALIAAAFALSLTLYAAAASLRLSDPAQNANSQPLDLFLIPIQFLQRTSRNKQALLLAALAFLACLLTTYFSRLDWDFTLQKIIALVVWIIAFAIFYVISPPNKRLARLWAYIFGVCLLAAYIGLLLVQPRWSNEENSPTPLGSAIDAVQGYDISFRLADTLLHDRFGPLRTSSGFYSFLADNTNIPRSRHIAPVDVNLVPHLTATPGRKPNIFVFVIDSLRRDYVSSYNPAVTFTPALDAFARDSIVFQNAFTRYGGTGLSEPSIWVGGLMLHQQYISPFAPMNSLQKLLDANHYREWISKDNILQQILPSSPNISELDANIGAMNYDLCRTLHELSDRLQSPPAGPIFVYTQPQNIHVSVIDREGRSVPAGVQFPSQFNPAYASRIQKLDACFGEFLAALKKTGLYDNSIIILTSDHGDSLGENGRWGHAYTLFPEIIRIPLIVHLPAWMQADVKFDPNSVAFLTDITPSLYYLLGQKPTANDSLFGHPLFAATLAEQQPYHRDSYLLASSYAPVYGLLTDSGRSLYIADGVNYRDYAYQLNPDGASHEAPLTEAERTAAQDAIQRQIEAIARFYHLQ